ncbi:MAG: 4Fe-4S binding protein [SAR324 cluster bacterium]|nr:4Fe-4S binding protein [SAR324 cluster bacterium]
MSLPDNASVERIPHIKEEECVGCNLCSLVCPVPDCIQMTDVSETNQVRTWNELMNAGHKIEDGVF